MRRLLSSVAVGAMALGSIGMFAGSASAATATLTLTPVANTVTSGAIATLSAVASEAGTVAFTAGGTAISGCSAEVTTSVAPFTATCPWLTPVSAVSPVAIGATLTPTVVADGPAVATPINVNVDPVALSGSAVYLGAKMTLTATAYEPGSVSFTDGGSAIAAGCTNETLALNGNNTAYVATCAFTPSVVGSHAFSVALTAGTSGSANLNLNVNTVVLTGGAGALVNVPTTLTATVNEAGTVAFATYVGSTATPITGCTAVATTGSAAPFTATCAYTATAAGAATVKATLTPTSANPATTSSPLTVTASTVVLSGGAAIYGVSPGVIVATANAAGAVSFFTVSGSTNTPISGCTGVATATAAPFVALCTWTPSAAGATVLGAAFTPTGGSASNAANLNVTVGYPIQGQQYPISLYVDTILASGASGATAPLIGAGCQITNMFLVGQTIVFRVYGNDAQLGGAPLTPANVSSATVTIAGVSAPLTLAYGSHGGVAFWTAPLATGTTAGKYNTLGIIPYTVTFNTVAVPASPAVTHSTIAHKIVNVRVKRGHKTVIVKKRVSYKKVWIDKAATKAIPGATGTFNSYFNPASQATLNAIPTV